MEALDIGMEAVLGSIAGLVVLAVTLGAVIYRAILGKGKARGIRRLKTEEIEKAKAEHAEATAALEEDRKIAREEAEKKLAALEEALSEPDPGKRADALTALHNKQKDRDA